MAASIPSTGVRVSVMGLAMLGLASCSSFEPEYISCTNLSALESAKHVKTTAAKTGNPIDMRFDGVSSRCVADDDGYDMSLSFALILRRDLSVYPKVEEVPVDLTIAYIDKDDQVVKRSVKKVTGFVPAGIEASRPKFVVNDSIPAGTRVVIALGKKIEE